LVASGAEVWATFLPPDAPPSLHPVQQEVTWIPLDLASPESVGQAVKIASPEVVFHLAAAGTTAPAISPLSALEVNVAGTIRLLSALDSSDTLRVLLMGTCHEYTAHGPSRSTDPGSFYAASKVASWAFARAFWRMSGLPVVYLRLFQVYGPGQQSRSLVPAAFGAALANEDFPMTAGEQLRDFVFVQDVAEALMAAAKAPDVSGAHLDVGTGHEETVRSVVEHIWAITRSTGCILLGAIPYRDGETMRIVADAKRTERMTGWRATTPLDEGLQATLKAFGT
jgi:UDP-glucose 4-epimerase